MSMTVQSIRSIFKKEDDSIMRIKYNPLYLSLYLVPFLVINLLYLIIWTAVDYPHAGSYSATEYNSQVLPSPFFLPPPLLSPTKKKSLRAKRDF